MFPTGQVEERVEDVEALGVSALNELVGVRLSGVGSVQSEQVHTR